MGSNIRISADKILPSQDFLKEGTIRFIFSCIDEGKLSDLPPAPIVRQHPESEALIAIDGHNIIAVRDFRGEDIEVYVADSRDDKLTGDSEAVAARNADLAEKFDSALEMSNQLASQGIATFKDLEAKYPDLFI